MIFVVLLFDSSSMLRHPFHSSDPWIGPCTVRTPNPNRNVRTSQSDHPQSIQTSCRPLLASSSRSFTSSSHHTISSRFHSYCSRVFKRISLASSGSLLGMSYDADECAFILLKPPVSDLVIEILSKSSAFQVLRPPDVPQFCLDFIRLFFAEPKRIERAVLLGSQTSSIFRTLHKWVIW
jgi:hypothetical protein